MDDTTLNGITDYLIKEDSELNTSMRDAERNLQQLTLQLTELSADMKDKKDKSKVEQIMLTGKQFVTQYENSVNELRKIKKKIFELVEQLAAKELETNPTDHVIRENRSRAGTVASLREYIDN